MLHANVAILESNEQFAQELKQFFAENTDLNVCGVSDDGIAGVDMIQNTNPDVILLSLILKGIDGFTVLDKLRESGKKYSVIIMGNFANEEIVSTAMSKGAKYYLIKPFAPEVAAARIMELLKMIILRRVKIFLSGKRKAPRRWTRRSAIFLSLSAFLRISRDIIICEKASSMRSQSPISSIT